MHGFFASLLPGHAICMGFKVILFFIEDINAICMGFKVISRSVCYMHGL